MEIINIYLTSEEQHAVKMLAEEKATHAIHKVCPVPTGKSLSLAFPRFINALKRKTGIKSVRNSDEAKAYLAMMAEAQKTPATPFHLETIRRILGIGFERDTFDTLAGRRGIHEREARQQYQEALHAIGIFATDASMQRVQARTYLASIAPVIKPLFPISDKRWEALRMYVSGHSLYDIAQYLQAARIAYAQEVIRQTCAELGITARGRGVQKRLICAALALHNQQSAPVTMDDPAF